MDRRQSINKRHKLYPYSDRLMTSTLQQLSFNCFTMTYINPLYDFYRWRSYQPQYLENETKFVSLVTIDPIFKTFEEKNVRLTPSPKSNGIPLKEIERKNHF